MQLEKLIDGEEKHEQSLEHKRCVSDAGANSGKHRSA
jgi:hypothetical protein